MGRTEVITKMNPLYSKEWFEALKTTNRKMATLGRSVHRLTNGAFVDGKVAKHIPSPFKSLTESIYTKGPPGSGKSWVIYAIAVQTFFAERRTWVLFDTKGSHLGNNRPNMKYLDIIRSMGGKPRGIPYTQIDVIAPEYYVQEATNEMILQKHITGMYRIPLRLLELNAMFELTKLNTGTSYASTFDQKFKDIKIQTRGNPKLADIYNVLSQYAQNKRMKRVAWTFDMLYQKIQDVADRVIDENHRWSRVGEALFRAASENKPRWIVFTFSLTRHPEEDMNLALVSSVLGEIYDFADYARMNNLRISLGVMIDELHTYVRNKDASTSQAIHDLLMAWGRTSRVLRCFLTQKDDQLPKGFRDEIGKMSPVGTYDVVIECRRIPTPGHLSYLSRATPSMDNPEIPLWYPLVRSCPPLCEVESDQPDDEKWKRDTAERYMRERKIPQYSKFFPPQVDNRMRFQPPAPI